MIMDDFLIYEKENNLFKLDANGFNYWHFLRKIVYDEILKYRNQTGQAHSNLRNESMLKKIALKLNQIPYYITKNPLWNLKKRDILILNHNRRVKTGDFYSCLYTDCFLEKISYSYYVFEEPLLEKHIIKTQTKNMRYIDYLNARFSIYLRIKKNILKIKLPEQILNDFKNLLEDIENDLSVRIDKEYLLKELENEYLRYKYMKKLYDKIIKKVSPKLIIEVVSYGSDKLLINELSKENGIPVIELQHGTMGKYHVAYNFAEKIDLNHFPDYVFTFGQFWKDNTRLPIAENKIKVVGWPYFEKKVNEFKKKEEFENASKKTILFISQGTIGKELSLLAVDVYKFLDRDEYRIIYKLHPGEYNRWKNEYPWLIDAKFEVIDHNQNDMHYYFAQSNIQVGVYSTAIFEGLAYGLKTYIFKLYGHQYMEELYNNNLALLFSDTSKFIEDLGSVNKSDNTFDVTYFWQDKSLDRMLTEISNIIEIKG